MDIRGKMIGNVASFLKLEKFEIDFRIDFLIESSKG